jgi:hypothetical protein
VRATGLDAKPLAELGISITEKQSITNILKKISNEYQREEMCVWGVKLAYA